MASLATNSPVPSSTSPSLLARLAQRLARRHAVRQTRRDLSRLSDHHLADIGLTRGMIEDVARRAAGSL